MVLICGKEYPLNEIFQIEENQQLIDPKGQSAVRLYILRSETVVKRPFWQRNIYFPSDFDWKWMTRRGTLVKRVAKYLRDEHGLRLENTEQSKIGTIASAFIRPATQSYIDLTDDFNWTPGTYSDGNSCYWGGRAASRPILERMNALAIRGYEKLPDGTFKPKARAWFFPYPDDPNCLIVMNGYGWDTRTFAHLLCQMTGHDMFEIALRASKPDNMIYINKGRAIFVGPAAEREYVIDFPDIRQVNYCECSRIKQYGLPRCRKCQREYDAIQLATSEAAQGSMEREEREGTNYPVAP